MSRCRFGLFEFDARTGELRREGQVVKLSPQPARVLALLLERPGEVVLREELHSHLWGDDTFVDFERGLNFCILQVRGALGDSSDNPRFVQTVPRKGYRFIAPVAHSHAQLPNAQLPNTQTLGAALRAPADAASPEAAAKAGSDLRVPAEAAGRAAAANLGPPAQLPLASRSGGSESGREGWSPDVSIPARSWVTAVAGVVILAPLVWLVWGLAPDTRGTPSTAAARPPARVRVAVLPFVNLTGDPAADDLADGLTDEVISQLGRLGADRLAVIARTSAMTYRDSEKTVRQIGRELNVGYVVESSLRRGEDGLRIGSSLIPVRDQSPMALWSEHFERGDATSPESHSAAIRLARLIALEIAPESAADPPRSTTNLMAWDAFLRGRALLNRGTPDDVMRAMAQFESAVQHDPMLAAAWAKLAEAQHLLVMMGARAPDAAYPSAREAAERALAADPHLPDAHLAHGLVALWYNRRPADAATSFERALALNASHAAAHHDYAWSLLAQGRDEEAVSHITTARDLDPLSTRANNDIGWLYLQLRRPAQAARACQHTLAVDAGALEAQACLERAYLQRGLHDAALRAARATLPPGSDQVVPARNTGQAPAAMQAVWRWRLQRLEQAARSRWISPYTLATHLVMVGDTDRALDHLEAALDQNVGMMVFLGRDPAVDPLRALPRFQTLLRQVSERPQ